MGSDLGRDGAWTVLETLGGTPKPRRFWYRVGWERRHNKSSGETFRTEPIFEYTTKARDGG